MILSGFSGSSIFKVFTGKAPLYAYFDTDTSVKYTFISCWKYKTLKEQNEGVIVQHNLDFAQPGLFSRIFIFALNV